MAILNYTTSIDANKTTGEIHAILARAKVAQISTDYSDGQPDGIRFSIDVGGRPLQFRLPCNVEGVYQSMCRSPKVTRAQRTREQARRVAWRIIKDWVEAQLAIIEAGQAEIAEAFLPYALGDDGRTAYQAFAESRKLLGGGNPNAD